MNNTLTQKQKNLLCDLIDGLFIHDSYVNATQQ